MKIESLETRIANAEIAVLAAELNRGTDIIAKALSKYLPVDVSGEKEGRPIAEEISAYINAMTWARVSYYAGYSLSTSATKDGFPKLFMDAVKSVACKQFLERIEQIEAIADEAHGLARRES